MTISNICLFNDNTPTYLHPATGSFTSIYLTMCSPSLFMDFTWRVEEDLHGSDHFPIILIESHYHPTGDRPPKWQFHKADWNPLKTCVWRPFFKMILMEVFTWKPLSTSFVKLTTKQYQNQIPTPRSHRSHGSLMSVKPLSHQLATSGNVLATNNFGHIANASPVHCHITSPTVISRRECFVKLGNFFGMFEKIAMHRQ